VVGEDEQGRIRVQCWKDFAQHVIHLLVGISDGGSILRGECGVVRRMFRIHQPPKHMRVQIHTLEVEEENAALEFWKLRIENFAMLV
jgi:hypothetical protein